MSPESYTTVGAAILYSGTALSTVGYVLMLTTAALFAGWRHNPTNQVWLYMCGANLAWTYLDITFYLWFYGCIGAPWLDSVVGFALHVFCGNYFFLASCGWMVAGAWLAHTNIVTTVTNGPDPKYTLKASLFVWVIPIPTSVSAAVLTTEAFKWNNNCMLVFVARGHVHIWLMVLSSVFMYARVLYSVCRSARASGRRRDRLATTLLAFMFALTSGVQYIVLFIYKYAPNKDFDDNALLLVKFFVISYSVSIYSMLFVVGIKQTRMLWFEYLAGKLGRSQRSDIATVT